MGVASNSAVTPGPGGKADLRRRCPGIHAFPSCGTQGVDHRRL